MPVAAEAGQIYLNVSNAETVVFVADFFSHTLHAPKQYIAQLNKNALRASLGSHLAN